MPGTARPEPPRKRAIAVYSALIVICVCASAAWRLHAGDRMFSRPTAAAPKLQLDPNTATWAELAALPDVGESLARRIVSYREARQAGGQHKPFRTLADLDAIQGVGPATLEALAPYLAF